MRHRMFAYAAPIALCIVALMQRYFVHAHNLSTWKGGGFGMFSTPAGNRELTITFVSSDGTETRIRRRDFFGLPLQRQHKDHLMSLIMMPSSAAFQQTIRDIDSYHWILVPRNSATPMPTDTPVDGDNGSVPAVDSAQDLATGPSTVPPEGLPNAVASKPLEMTYLPIPKDFVPANRLVGAVEVASISVELWEYRLDDSGRYLKLTRLATMKLDHN